MAGRQMNFKSPSQKADFVKDNPGLAKSMGISKPKPVKLAGAIARRLQKGAK
jgi:hypothetical protein